jgi:hypothetical protein
MTTRALLAGCLILATALADHRAAVARQPNEAESAPAAKVRRFTFNYRFRVKGLTSPADDREQHVKVWIPCPPSSDCQEVTRLPAKAPARISEHQELRYGKGILFFQAPCPATGEFTVDIPYEIVRREVLRQPLEQDVPTESLNAAERALFLRADRLVPTTGKPLRLLTPLELKKDKLDLARQLYDLVDAHVTYKKEGVGWGRGDTNWVCDSRYGNCTDFHSLFMSLARSQGLPVRFEIGFSLPTDRSEGPIAGYHCWAWFHLEGRGWIPVDISEADKHPQMKDYYFGNLTADRVLFSIGRDLELVPRANDAPLNYFIYPHVEVGGEPLGPENIELQMTFKDLR